MTENFFKKKKKVVSIYSVWIVLVFKWIQSKCVFLEPQKIFKIETVSYLGQKEKFFCLVFFGKSLVRISYKMYKMETAHHRGQERAKCSGGCRVVMHMGTHACRGTYEMQSVRLAYTWACMHVCMWRYICNVWWLTWECRDTGGKYAMWRHGWPYKWHIHTHVVCSWCQSAACQPSCRKSRHSFFFIFLKFYYFYFSSFSFIYLFIN